MQRIIPHIWCDRVADEAAEFYVGALPDTRLLESTRYPTEGLLPFQTEFAGKTLVHTLEVGEQQLALINAGDEFTPNPAISFFLNFDPSRDAGAEAALQRTWEKLREGGRILMELGEYPFSPCYGWVQDRYGVSWQLILTDPAGDPRPFLITALMFSGPVQNRAGEATDHYLGLLPDSRPGHRVNYPEAQGEVTTDSVLFSDFQLYGQWFSAMDSGVPQPFTFTAGISLQINATDQAEIDRLWAGLSHDPEAEQCGWCWDRWGVSWQIIPENFAELMARPGSYEVLMGQGKIIIGEY